MGVRALKRVQRVRTKVAGVTFRNADGSSRQRIIRAFCRAGEPLYVTPEPNNPYSKNALGLWVQGTEFIVAPARYQIGYVNNRLAAHFRKLIDEGWAISARILNVTGGGWIWKRTRGVNIEVTLELDEDDAPEGKRRSSFPERPLRNAATSVSWRPTFLTRWLSLITSAKPIPLRIAKAVRRTARRLLDHFVALSRNHQIIVAGAGLCAVGIALWTVGYLLGSACGALKAMRPPGVVTAIVGLGTLSLGIVFWWSDLSK
jgi:hypothetical protein